MTPTGRGPGKVHYGMDLIAASGKDASRGFNRAWIHPRLARSRFRSIGAVMCPTDGEHSLQHRRRQRSSSAGDRTPHVTLRHRAAMLPSDRPCDWICPPGDRFVDLSRIPSSRKVSLRALLQWADVMRLTAICSSSAAKYHLPSLIRAWAADLRYRESFARTQSPDRSSLRLRECDGSLDLTVERWERFSDASRLGTACN